MFEFFALDEPWTGLSILIISWFACSFYCFKLVKALSDQHRKDYADVSRSFVLFRAGPICFFVIYILVYYTIPDYKGGAFLILWMLYNIFHFFYFRWLMKAMKDISLPPDFIQRYMMTRILSYVGVILSLLLLFEGGHLN